MTPDSFIESPSGALTLVMATRGRSQPIGRFLDAMRQQTVAGVELLIVDQNEDDRVRRAIEGREGDVCVRVIRAQPGLSRARNIGAGQARAELLGFPDDDCWYSPGFLDRVVRWFADHPEAHGLSCLVCDERGRGSAGGFMSRRAQWITRSNVWRTATTPGLFVRRIVHETVGGFDEQLGVGAKWGSGEETDYVLRAVERGFHLYYDPSFRVLHPRRVMPPRKGAAERGWGYGRGAGYVLAKNNYGPLATLYYAAIPLLAAPLALLRAEPGKAIERLWASAGRLSGWWRGRAEVDRA